ncbi:MAG: DUF4831 family protein [Paludibacteraceae bacterium]|nr:DUF4831 family protein [Paludibacteraceae bacterium]MBP3716667.1 DUF4831 family protein [Paludibacteraceae bacterium]
MKKFLISTLVICAASAYSQNAVVSVKDRETNSKDEVVASYYLPKTVFEIEIEAVNKKFKAGPFANDAKRYFGTNAESQDKDAWEIKNVTIKKKTEPDPSQHYKVYASYGSAGSLVSLTNNNILRGVNIPVGFDNTVLSQNVKPQCAQSCQKKYEPADCACQFKTNFKYKENDSTPDVGNAKFAYDLINSLRMAKADLLQQNDEVKDIDASVRNIDKEENSLYELFYGKTCVEETRMTFMFSPDKEGNNQEVCKFSSRNGFAESGDALTISIKKKGNTNRVSNASGKTGYVYRIPAMADVEVKQGKNTLWKGTFAIPQLGTTESLPAGFFDKNDLKALFDKETGALLQISK